MTLCHHGKDHDDLPRDDVTHHHFNKQPRCAVTLSHINILASFCWCTCHSAQPLATYRFIHDVLTNSIRNSVQKAISTAHRFLEIKTAGVINYASWCGREIRTIHSICKKIE